MLQLATLPVPGVVLVDWSRTGTYLTTAQRPGKGADGQAAKNIKVRALAIGVCVGVWKEGFFCRGRRSLPACLPHTTTATAANRRQSPPTGVGRVVRRARV